MQADQLHDIFSAHPHETQIEFHGHCHDCGAPVGLKVSLKPEGFLVEGGALYEPAEDKRFYKCESCYRANPKLTGWQSCEVYSRIVGYLRPVSQWNNGKQNEFANRKHFDQAIPSAS